MSEQLNDAVLEDVILQMRSGNSDQLDRVKELLAEHPEDARLHFLAGSMLVQSGRLIEGYNSLKRAVVIAPDFAVARFQLGLFQLTSGETANALETFGHLDVLPDGHYFRSFVDGLRCLIRDDFNGVVTHLRNGIRANSDNAPLNTDMELIVQQCLPLLEGSSGDDEASVSETSLVLRQLSGRRSLN